MADAERDMKRCYYCGEPAGTVDHTVPRAALKATTGPAGRAVLIRGHELLTVPACGECNSLLGAQTFASLSARVRAAKGALRRRYRKLLALPDWNDLELAWLEPAMRAKVRATIGMRDAVRQRIEWSGGPLVPAGKAAKVRRSRAPRERPPARMPTAPRSSESLPPLTAAEKRAYSRALTFIRAGARILEQLRDPDYEPGAADG